MSLMPSLFDSQPLTCKTIHLALTHTAVFAMLPVSMKAAKRNYIYSGPIAMTVAMVSRFATWHTAGKQEEIS
jgi:hypothetical protein